MGRNNPGKISLTEIFRRLLSHKKTTFIIHDFNIGCIPAFKQALSNKINLKEYAELRDNLPVIECRVKISYDPNIPDLGMLSEFIVDLNTNTTIVVYSKFKAATWSGFYKCTNRCDITNIETMYLVRC